MLVVNSQLSVPLKELNLTFSRSGGPGGQNVNKVNTKVTLHWRVGKNKSLPDAVQARFAEAQKNRINKDGDFVISSQRFRDQGRNVGDCLAKLRTLIESAATPPKARQKTRVPLRAKRKRINEKRRVSEKKQSRRPPGMSD